ncbi:Juvenile hormone acid O-methyltransferase [Orchesella cincta]|uniref:Juvenile hormone acid O-methyltransferase n=1 Tax=Orchesella cincta TaxID=48709 RepID=A0A1D2NM79_ORCCI|nr:Juvenile hormone acid O-methyltransferase [Orchesella cincta]
MYDPERYEKFKSAAARDAAEFAPKLVSEMEWNSKEVILDYGCGAGSTGFNFILPTVEKHDSKLFSVDISEKMIEFAEKEYAHPRITYAVGDILGDFPYKSMQFDKILSIYVLHFVKDYREAVKKFYNALKPGSQLGFTVVGQSRIFQALVDIGSRETWKDIMKGYEKYVPEWVEKKQDVQKCFKDALTSAGFEIQKIELHNQKWKYSTLDSFVEFYMSLNPFVRNLSPNQLKQMKDDYIDMVKNQWNALGDDGQPAEGKYELLYVLAKKPLQ